MRTHLLIDAIVRQTTVPEFVQVFRRNAERYRR